MDRRECMLGLLGTMGAVALGRAAPVGAAGPEPLPTAPMIAGPDPDPRTPAFKAPKGPSTRTATSSARSPAIPYAPTRPYTPPEAPLDAFRALHRRIGVDRAVIVNATRYGRDNRVVARCHRAERGAYRGIANVDDKTTDRELEDAGARAGSTAAASRSCRGWAACPT